MCIRVDGFSVCDKYNRKQSRERGVRIAKVGLNLNRLWRWLSKKIAIWAEHDFEEGSEGDSFEGNLSLFFFSLLLLLLSRFSCVQLCVPPQTAAHQAPPSLGFSRQEHWSGLPFPSPMHEWKVKVKSLSRGRLLATPWTAAYQAPPSMGFSRQECWSGVPLPSPLLKAS